MVLRVVIDSNRLQSDDLRAFLQVSPNNFAVLTDYAWIEAYKGNSLVSIQKSMGVLKDFPQQLIVLKSTRAICGIEPGPTRMASGMAGKGREFHQTVTGLAQAQAGDPAAIAQIVGHGESADRQMAKLLADAVDLPVVFQEMLRTYFTREEIAHIRAGRPHTLDLVRKVLEVADALAETLSGGTRTGCGRPIAVRGSTASSIATRSPRCSISSDGYARGARWRRRPRRCATT